VGTEDAVPLPAVILPSPLEGAGVAHGNCPGPAGMILRQAGWGAPGQSGGEKGFPGWGGGCARAVWVRVDSHVAAPRPAQGAQAAPQATGPTRLGSRGLPPWGAATTPGRAARGAAASRAGRLFGAGPRDAVSAAWAATWRAWRCWENARPRGPPRATAGPRPGSHSHRPPGSGWGERASAGRGKRGSPGPTAGEHDPAC
jgi:hypothetical protein